MDIQAWMLKSWPLVAWRLPESSNEWPQFSHANTTIRDSDEDGEVATSRGETVWVATVGKHSVALAWEWAQLRQGIVMLADPNSILSNIRFLDKELHYQEGLVAILCLNRLTHELPWQPTVAAMVMATQEHPEIAARGPAQARPWARASQRRVANTASQL
jgi:hypothetical protein